jgi:hypothetical protein
MGFFLLSLCPLSLLSLYLCVVQVDLITTKERYRGWADKVAGWAALLVNGFDKQRVQVVPHALDDGLEVQVGDYMAVFQRMVDFCIWATSQIELEVAAAKANMATGNGTGLGRGEVGTPGHLIRYRITDRIVPTYQVPEPCTWRVAPLARLHNGMSMTLDTCLCPIASLEA